MNKMPNLPNLNALKIFLTLADCGSMKTTSELYGVSMSAVSQTISALEAQLGCTLIDRKVRPLGLTLAGRLLAKEGAKLVLDAHRLTDTLQTHSLESLNLRIGFSESVSHSIVPFICAGLFKKVKTFSAQTAMTQTLRDALLKRELDILVSPERFDEETAFFRTPLWTESYLLVLPKDEKPIQKLYELRKLASRLPYIRFNVDSTDRIESERIFRQLDIEQRESVGVESSFSMVGLVAQGLGWAIMPPWGIWQGRDWISHIAFQPIPQLTVKRTQWIVSASRGFEPLAQAIKTEAQADYLKHLKSWLDHYRDGLSDFVELL